MWQVSVGRSKAELSGSDRSLNNGKASLLHLFSPSTSAPWCLPLQELIPHQITCWDTIEVGLSQCIAPRSLWVWNQSSRKTKRIEIFFGEVLWTSIISTSHPTGVNWSDLSSGKSRTCGEEEASLTSFGHQPLTHTVNWILFFMLFGTKRIICWSNGLETQEHIFVCSSDIFFEYIFSRHLIGREWVKGMESITQLTSRVRRGERWSFHTVHRPV